VLLERHVAEREGVDAAIAGVCCKEICVPIFLPEFFAPIFDTHPVVVKQGIQSDRNSITHGEHVDTADDRAVAP
jgi:hypothetical protein